MDTPLFLRIRGRVLGPYEQEKLQGLAKRGQLSRMHELSTDGATWVRASNYPELFTASQDSMPVQEDSSSSKSSVSDPSDSREAAGGTSSATGKGAPSPPQWFYSSAGTERGPVDFAHLQMLVGTGQVTPQDLIWTDGMAAWVPANSVAGLFRATTPTAAPSGYAQDAAAGSDFQGTANQPARGADSMDRLPEGLVRSVQSSRGWVLFIAITLFILAALEAALGVFLLVRGARVPLAAYGLVATGVVALVFAIAIALGGLFLLAYASRIGTVRFEPRAIVLEKAMDALRAFWIYLAVLLIIILILLPIFVVIAIAEGALVV